MPIEFDYILKRYEGSRTRQFKPEAIKSPLSNISIISAPNSSGKSTLMNIIALSLFGTDVKAVSVNESLKKQISALTDHNIQDITFHLRITDPSGMNGLVVSKDSFSSMDIIRKEIINGAEKLIDSDRFHMKYKLIYDIPDNPLERLKELTANIKNQQSSWILRLNLLLTYINTNMKELLKRKKEYDTDSINKNKTEAQGNLELARNNKESFQKKQQLLNKYYYLRKYLELEKEYNSIKDESKEVNKEKRERIEEQRGKEYEFRKKAEEKGKIQEKIKQLKEWIGLNIAETDIAQISGFSKWKLKIKQTPTKQTLDEDLVFLKEIEDKCTEELKKYEDKSSMMEVEFYDKLLLWIRENMISNYKVPGTEITFSLLMEKLENIVKENRKVINDKRRLENIIKWIEELKEKIDEFNELGTTISEKYKDMTDAHLESKLKEIFEDKKDYDSLKKQLKKDMQALVFNLSKFGVNEEDDFQTLFNGLIIRFPELQSYDSISLNRIDSEISELGRKIESMSDDERRESLRIEALNKQLEEAMNAEPHKYNGKYEQLKTLADSIDDLSRKVAKWDRYIGDFKVKNPNANENIRFDSERMDYFNKVSIYLARRMASVTHIDRKYELKKVDLINSKFIATDDTVIHFQVMGAGQKQLSYILNKLSYDGRSIIAMFDEVAMMSPTTMREIVSKMRNLMDDNGKLLVGLLVSPSDEVNILDG
jgi:exonuclease SbcC